MDQMRLRFDVKPANIDERRDRDETPRAYVERLARCKAQAGHEAGRVSIGADTVVVVDGEILGKPRGQTEGLEMIRRLSGRAHDVFTAVAVCDGQRCECTVVASTVWFREVSADEARDYCASGEGADKAGGYGIQGIGGIFAERIEGSFSAVMGLPVLHTEALLQSLDVDTWSMRLDG
jgi:septum formation protein